MVEPSGDSRRSRPLDLGDKLFVVGVGLVAVFVFVAMPVVLLLAAIEGHP